MWTGWSYGLIFVVVSNNSPHSFSHWWLTLHQIDCKPFLSHAQNMGEHIASNMSNFNYPFQPKCHPHNTNRRHRNQFTFHKTIKWQWIRHYSVYVRCCCCGCNIWNMHYNGHLDAYTYRCCVMSTTCTIHRLLHWISILVARWCCSLLLLLVLLLLLMLLSHAFWWFADVVHSAVRFAWRVCVLCVPSHDGNSQIQLALANQLRVGTTRKGGGEGGGWRNIVHTVEMWDLSHTSSILDGKWLQEPHINNNCLVLW